MRRAEWRRRADDPNTTLGWWWRGAVGKEWPFHLLASVAVGTAIITRIAWLGAVGVLVAVASAAVRAFRGPDRLAALLPVPAPPGQFRASVTYRRDGLITGRDEMGLVVVDGWLYAEGVRSHFALRSADVREARMWDERMDHKERLFLRDGTEIRLRGIAYDASARATLEGWRRSQAPEGEPTFPPVRVHPQELARWQFWGVLGMGMIGLPNVVAAYLHLSGRYADIRGLFSLLAFGLAWFAGRRFFRLGEMTMAVARREALAGQAPPLQNGLSPVLYRDAPRPSQGTPPLPDEPLGEGESVRA